MTQNNGLYSTISKNIALTELWVRASEKREGRMAGRIWHEPEKKRAGDRADPGLIRKEKGWRKGESGFRFSPPAAPLTRCA